MTGEALRVLHVQVARRIFHDGAEHLVDVPYYSSDIEKAFTILALMLNLLGRHSVVLILADDGSALCRVGTGYARVTREETLGDTFAAASSLAICRAALDSLGKDSR